MLAGYARFMNDNIRTAHLKCANCKTQVHLIKIEADSEGGEVRSFACRHCADVSAVRFQREAEDGFRRDLGAR